MKKLLLCVTVYLIAANPFRTVNADEPLAANIVSTESYISHLYRQIDFGEHPLSFDVFDKAYHGYVNLRNSGKLNTDRPIMTVCDFTLSSTEQRMWIIDLANRKVILNTYVAHGQGSGEEYATSFSNRTNSHQSSLGFYVTGETYDGEHGTSLKLYGMDNGFNNNAYERGIVVHGARYVSSRFIDNNDKLGRSWGCPAVPDKLSDTIINTIKDGTCLFIYYPQKKYLASAYWLNKKIDSLPGRSFGNDFQYPVVKNTKSDTVIKYVSADGATDSIKTIQHSF